MEAEKYLAITNLSVLDAIVGRVVFGHDAPGIGTAPPYHLGAPVLLAVVEAARRGLRREDGAGTDLASDVADGQSQENAIRDDVIRAPRDRRKESTAGGDARRLGRPALIIIKGGELFIKNRLEHG